jgi:hypothetical protein
MPRRGIKPVNGGILYARKICGLWSANLCLSVIDTYKFAAQLEAMTKFLMSLWAYGRRLSYRGQCLAGKQCVCWI